MSIKKSQAILECFIDLKSSIWFTLGSEDKTIFCDTTDLFYFGGARSKGFATLRNLSKLQFFDKIGQVKSVGFRLYSAI